MIPALLGLPSKVKTLVDRLTAARAGYLDLLNTNLDAKVSERLGSIKAIYRGTITVTLSAGVGSNTATITSVNTAKSIVSLLGFTPDSAYSALAWARVTLTNSTTVTANAAGGSDRAITVTYQVVEFN